MRGFPIALLNYNKYTIVLIASKNFSVHSMVAKRYSSNINNSRTKVSRLCYFFVTMVSPCSYKWKLYPFFVKEILIKIAFKEVRAFKNLNPIMYIFKGHAKIVKINMVKYNVTILNKKTTLYQLIHLFNWRRVSRTALHALSSHLIICKSFL